VGPLNDEPVYRNVTIRRREEQVDSKRNWIWFIALVLSAVVQLPLLAQDRGNWSGNDDWNNDSARRLESIRANITGGGGNGKCTFEVAVNGVAEVEIRGGEGRLRTLSGTAATWRRLSCNQPLPLNPNDFKFSGVDGHGQQSLVQAPNGNNGVAVIRIDNGTRNNNEGYTGDITWKGGDNYGSGWSGGPAYDRHDSGWGGGNFGSAALPNTTTESQQSDGTTAVRGEEQYQAENGSLGKFSYRCLYDRANQRIVDSSCSRE
jgi:hypothetical protein